MNKTTLYIIQGFIASGKTTFSNELANKTKAIHLNPDKMVGEIFQENEYMNNWNYCFDCALKKMYEQAKIYLKSGKDVILDMGFWLKRDRIYAKDIAKQCNANFIHYYLKVDDKVLKERIIKSRPEKWAKIHIQNFEKNKSVFEEPDIDENVILVNNV